MEVRVFFRGKAPTKGALARAMRELGFPFTIPDAKGSLEQHSGFMPMKLRGEETGVEFDLYRDRAAIAEFASYGIDRSYERMAAFRWGGDRQEAAAGVCGAAALAKLTGGVVFDDTEGRVLTHPEAIATAKELFDALSKPDARQPGTRPVDIKRYLKPLLELRSDLVLVDRMLVIRPVRHILRGVFFDRTSRRSVLRLYWFLKPLYAGAAGIHGESITHLDTRMPYFDAMLFDFLRGDAFDAIGKVTSFKDYIEFWNRQRDRPFLFMPTLLGAGSDEAKHYLDEFERRFGSRLEVRESRAILDEDLGKLLDRYRRLEMETVNELKIGDIWEQSPFPAELLIQDRAAKSGEAPFLTNPWVNYSTAWRQDAPDVIGDVRFGTSWRLRDNRPFLVNPLTFEQAEKKHNGREIYVLSARLSDGPLIVLHRYTTATDLELSTGRTPPITYRMWVYGQSNEFLLAEFRELSDQIGTLQLRSIDVKIAGSGESRWYSLLDFDKRKKNIHDSRGEKRLYIPRPMNEADLLTYAFPTPQIDQFSQLWQRVSQYLESEGFGRFA